jgi:hypothetical protein
MSAFARRKSFVTYLGTLEKMPIRNIIPRLDGQGSDVWKSRNKVGKPGTAIATKWKRTEGLK